MMQFFDAHPWIWAAFAAVVAASVAVRTFFAPRLDSRRAAASVSITRESIEVAVYARKAVGRFVLLNGGKRSALIDSLDLVVDEFAPTTVFKRTVTAAPVTVAQHRVELVPGVMRYSLRGRLFSAQLPPTQLGGEEMEAHVVEIVGRSSGWYSLHFEAEWRDSGVPSKVRRCSSNGVQVEFPRNQSDEPR